MFQFKLWSGLFRLQGFIGITPMLSKNLDTYAENDGWSSKLFAPNAVPLMKKLMEEGVPLQVGRHVVYIGPKDNMIKAYVHHNGRSPEYATFTDKKGNELATFHHTEFEQLEAFVWTKVKSEQGSGQ